MEVRMRLPKIGQRAYINPRQGETIRQGWARFYPVTVVSMKEQGTCLVTIRDDHGATTEVLHIELDCGCDFHWPGRGWLPESHPDALRYVRSLLEAPAHENSTLERGHDGYQRWLRHILARNVA